MKKSSKLMSVLLIVAMLFTLAAPAMAADGDAGTTKPGSITITDAVVDQTYTAYRILDLESYDADAKAYAYKANSEWEEWLESPAVKDVYVNIDAQGYVKWVEGASAADFAAKAQKQLTGKTAAGSVKAVEGTNTVIGNLDLGYYLVDTTLGALCSLDTTNPDVEMKEKNEAPTVTKEVEEDSTSEWGATNDADINQVVNYKAVIKVKAGAEKYILHDTMSAGLTFDPDSVKVTVDGKSVDADGNYEVKTGLNDGCTFEVIFSDDYITKLAAGLKNSDDGTAAAEKEIIVKYSATLNENAYVGSTTADNPGNTNKVKLQYNDSYTTEDITTTYTWDMNVLKYGDGDKRKVLAGAEFVLLNSQKNKVAKIANGKLTGWVAVPVADEEGNISWPANTTLTTNADGEIAIEGLDADTYHLREIKAPAGYNKLNQDTDVTVTRQVSTDGKTMTYTKVTSEINNQSGAELPSTGGIGTTIFYVVGGALVLGAVVLLVTRRRMAE